MALSASAADDDVNKNALPINRLVADVAKGVVTGTVDVERSVAVRKIGNDNTLGRADNGVSLFSGGEKRAEIVEVLVSAKNDGKVPLGESTHHGSYGGRYNMEALWRSRIEYAAVIVVFKSLH